MQGPAVAPWLLVTLTLLSFWGKPHFQVAPSLKEHSHSRCVAFIFWFCLVLARGENASFCLRSGCHQKLGCTHTGLGPLQHCLFLQVICHARDPRRGKSFTALTQLLTCTLYTGLPQTLQEAQLLSPQDSVLAYVNKSEPNSYQSWSGSKVTQNSIFF